MIVGRLHHLVAVWVALALLAALGVPSPAGQAAPPPRKRVAFLVESWYPWSHADVIGTRFLEGYRLGEKAYPSPVTVASVHTDAPRPTDQTRVLAARYGFKVASSVAEALLEDPRSSRPRLAVDGILIATREDPPPNGQLPSPTPRLQLMKEIFRILDQAGARVPIFLDKMLAANWADAQAIVAEAARRGIPLMAGSVVPYMPVDRPLRAGKVEVGMVIVAGPYWAYAFHATELLQGYMEQRGPRETGVTSIRATGGLAALPDGEVWGRRLFEPLLASARTGGRGARGRAEPVVNLITYADGTRGVVVLLPGAFDEAEFLLGAQFADATISTGGVILRREPFDHFAYLVHALVEFYTTGRAVVPVERALLTTGIVLLGQDSRLQGVPVASPGLAVTYPTPRRRP